MIPKKIHYCWFGGAPLPELAKKCIATWEKFCPDYEIIEWNESNYDVDKALYTQEAYRAKKWAFITDYVRLFVIYHFGGIYMDTDVEVVKPLDRFLKHSAFSGFENESAIPTGIMGGEAGNKWYKELLDYYTDRHFILPDGSCDMTTNVVTITRITQEKYSVQLNNTYQELNDGLCFYPSEYFCPVNYWTHKLEMIENTYTIHHWAGSWVCEEDKKYANFVAALCRVFGIRFGRAIGLGYYGLKNIPKKGLKWFFGRVKNKVMKKNYD